MPRFKTTADRREQVARSNCRYYRRNREKVREASRLRDAQRPEDRNARNARFEARHPTYWREYYHRRKFRLAWMHWLRVCATPPGERR